MLRNLIPSYGRFRLGVSGALPIDGVYITMFFISKLSTDFNQIGVAVIPYGPP